MKKIQIILFILLLISLKGFSQYSNFEIKYYGGADAEIDGTSDIVDVRIPSGTTLTFCDIVVYHPNTYYSSGQNIQTADNIEIYSTSGNFDVTENYDIYGNAYTKFSLNTNQTSDFLVQQFYNAETEAVLTPGFTSSAPFPTNITSEYTMATSNIQSNDPDIANKAASLTSGCTKMQDAVEKISKWVIGSLSYKSSTNNNEDMDASSVFDRKSGNCAGYTNLIIALLRSVDIPARFISGTGKNHPN